LWDGGLLFSNEADRRNLGVARIEDRDHAEWGGAMHHQQVGEEQQTIAPTNANRPHTGRRSARLR
jgi:hypothetical protein